MVAIIERIHQSSDIAFCQARTAVLAHQSILSTTSSITPSNARIPVFAVAGLQQGARDVSQSFTDQ